MKGLRPEWSSITIGQLLNHTSGLARDFVQVSRAAEKLPGDSLIAMEARDTLVSKPGTVYAYSNTGYMLLGVLIEKVNGNPYGVVLRDEIARPLGLTSLGWCENMAGDRAAAGYIRSSDGKVGPPVEQHVSQSIGAGAICSTAGDLAKWNQALHGGRVVRGASGPEAGVWVIAETSDLLTKFAKIVVTGWNRLFLSSPGARLHDCRAQTTTRLRTSSLTTSVSYWSEVRKNCSSCFQESASARA